MNTQSNGYTVVFSTIMVVVVAAALTLISLGLKDRQQVNIDNEKRQNILKSAGIAIEGKVSDENAQKYGFILEKGTVEDTYKKYVNEDDCFIVDTLGNVVEGKAFEVNTKKEKNKLPVFVVNKNGEKLYVVPLTGNGLWGAIWGYASLKSDFNTINGVVFDHASETPGLGAEMTQLYFCEQFEGRQMYEGNDFLGIMNVYKGNPKNPNDDQDKLHGIDAISGSTLTTKGVQDMVNKSLKAYGAYKNSVQTSAQPVVGEVSDDAQQTTLTNVNE